MAKTRIMIKYVTEAALDALEFDPAADALEWDKLEYTTAGPFPTLEDAARAVTERDVNAEGEVLVQEYDPDVAGGWTTTEWLDPYDLILTPAY